MSNHIFSYDPNLKKLAQNLRKNSTLAEILLWQGLKNRSCLDHDFHRQKPIGKYIVDFFCPDLMLAIEIDGITHNEKFDKDRTRQKELEQLGISFLRFTDDEVKKNLDGVLAVIKNWALQTQETNTPRPNGHPSLEGT
ncbi:MAG: endonuclease domain-containing protein [Pelosinus sp.]|nr:endonuclease domain-containing protein [Pelosinus sp.]